MYGVNYALYLTAEVITLYPKTAGQSSGGCLSIVAIGFVLLLFAGSETFRGVVILIVIAIVLVSLISLLRSNNQTNRTSYKQAATDHKSYVQDSSYTHGSRRKLVATYKHKYPKKVGQADSTLLTFSQAVDEISGRDFEKYVERLLKERGFNTILTPGSGDFGVDIIARKDDEKIAVQVKRYKTNVSRRAVSDAVAGKEHYECNKAWVITNSYYTKDAKALASSTNCRLIDRDQLLRWHEGSVSSSTRSQQTTRHSATYTSQQSPNGTSWQDPIDVPFKPLFKVKNEWHVDEADTFVKAALRVNSRSNADWTPLMLAARYSGRPEVLKVLAKRYPEDIGRKNTSGKGAVDYAAQNPALSNADIFS